MCKQSKKDWEFVDRNGHLHLNCTHHDGTNEVQFYKLTKKGAENFHNWEYNSYMSYRYLEIAPVVKELLPENKVLLAERDPVSAGVSRKFFLVDKGFYHLSSPDFEDGFASGEFLYHKVARCDFTHKKTSTVR